MNPSHFQNVSLDNGIQNGKVRGYRCHESCDVFFLHFRDVAPAG